MLRTLNQALGPIPQKISIGVEFREITELCSPAPHFLRSPFSTGAQQVTLHQFSVFVGRRFRHGLLAHSVVNGVGMFPKLLNNGATAVRILERR